ncbi:MAG: oxygen-independent coproporphyrinogen III oxidase [Gemmatimonadaceae bacterium]|nr:oxygen-independent coproporphyrinogen III oxidase [Gemmatimonadaceae bacterium]
MLSLGDLAEPVPADLLAKYDVAGPRYTSYPTVPAWRDDFAPDDFARALRAAGATGTPVALYGHFPYCAAKCFYCGCNAVTTSRPEAIDRYLDDLERELDCVVGELGRFHRTAQLHWGGGTPNHLDDRQLERAFRLYADRFRFTDEVELSLEADPRLVSREQLRTLRALGFTRISFGVQDLDRNVQEAIGRLQSPALVRDVCESAREAGFTGLNIDLIYGLPRQTPESFARTIDEALRLGPDRVACFGYAHLPSSRPHQRVIEEAELPDAPERAALFQLAVRRFTEAGYAWIGLDHFAKADDPLAVAQREGRLHRNFMGYTTMPAAHLVGTGMSAISDVGGAFAQNEARLGPWRERVDAGRLSTVRGLWLSDDDRARKHAIQQLMCNLELAFDDIPPGVDDLRARFAPFEDDGFVEFGVDRVQVTPRGRFFIRNLCMELDAYLPTQQGQGRFSRTV